MAKFKVKVKVEAVERPGVVLEAVEKEMLVGGVDILDGLREALELVEVIEEEEEFIFGLEDGRFLVEVAGRGYEEVTEEELREDGLWQDEQKFRVKMGSGEAELREWDGERLVRLEIVEVE